MLNFKEFCDGWFNAWLQLNKQELTKHEKAKLEGKKFEEHILKHLLSSFVPRGYRIAYQRKIRGVNYEFDFMFVRPGASDFYDIEPSEALAVFEVKAHGFYRYGCE
jgi:hypothetical protein